MLLLTGLMQPHSVHLKSFLLLHPASHQHNFGGLQQTPTLDHPKGLLEGEQGQGEKQEKGAWIPRNLIAPFILPNLVKVLPVKVLRFKIPQRQQGSYIPFKIYQVKI